MAQKKRRSGGLREAIRAVRRTRRLRNRGLVSQAKAFVRKLRT